MQRSPLLQLSFSFLYIALCALIVPITTAHAIANAQTKSPQQTDSTAPFRPGWSIRHKITLNIPQFKLMLPFDGVVELSQDHKQFRALGVASGGITLFAISATSTDHTIHGMHPSLEHLPHFEHSAVAALRLLLNDVLALQLVPAKAQSSPYTQKNTFRQHDRQVTVTKLNGNVISAISVTPSEHWIANVYYSAQTAPAGLCQPAMPQRVTLLNVTKQFSVDITFITSQKLP